jgi:hypothetical protein
MQKRGNKSIKMTEMSVVEESVLCNTTEPSHISDNGLQEINIFLLTYCPIR